MKEVFDMMMLMHDFKDKKVAFFGVGNVGARKVKYFIDSGAKVHVMDKVISEEIASLPGIEIFETEIQLCMIHQLIKDMALVVAATNDEELNREIASIAKRQGVWVNVVDDPDACDVYFPSIVKRGNLVIGIGTSGSSPSVSRFARENIERIVSAEYGPMVQLQEEVRTQLRETTVPMEERRAVMRRILESEEVWALLKAGKMSEAKELALKLVRR